MSKEQTKKDKKNGGRLSAIIKTLVKYKVVLGINPVKLRMIFEELGPTYVKLGQILSMRPDLIEYKYCKELEQLRSNVKPMTTETVKQRIFEELGKSVDEIFSEFNEKPLGSASIAQAHSAVLKTGEKVVVKVQRPNIYETMKADIDMLKKACSVLKLDKIFKGQLNFVEILDEMWKTTQEELDFTVEASNIHEMQLNNQKIKYVKFPKVYDEFSTTRILTMEKINGIKIDDLEKLKEQGYDLEEIGKKLCENYVKQIFDDAFFHADPHPGNIFVEDGKIAWIDLGMVGRLDEITKKLINNCIKDIVNGDVDALMSDILKLCPPRKDTDQDALRQDIVLLMNKYINMNIQNINIAEVMTELLGCVTANKLKVPSNLTMYIRGLLTIEDVVAKLSPNLNIMDIIKNHLSTSFLADLIAPEQFLDMGKSVAKSFKRSLVIPAQISQILDMQLKGKNKNTIEHNISKQTMDFKKLQFNKWALLIIASLIIVVSTVFATIVSTTSIIVPTISICGYILSFILICAMFLIGGNKKKK